MYIELFLIHITDINLSCSVITEQTATLFLDVAFKKLTIIFVCVCQDNYHVNENMT